MRTPVLRTSGGNLSRLIAPLLLVWMSGVGCLVHCAAICADEAASACVATTASEAGEASHGCCHDAAPPAGAATADEPGGDDIRGPRDVEVCCLLATRRPSAASVPPGVDTPVAPAVSRVFLAAPQTSVPPVHRATEPVLNRGDTHLRGCVFLI